MILEVELNPLKAQLMFSLNSQLLCKFSLPFPITIRTCMQSIEHLQPLKVTENDPKCAISQESESVKPQQLHTSQS